MELQHSLLNIALAYANLVWNLPRLSVHPLYPRSCSSSPCSAAPTMPVHLSVDHLILYLQKTWLIRCLIIIMLEWPMELVIAVWSLCAIKLTTWFRCIVPACFSDYRPRPMRAFSAAIWDYRPQQLLCSTHFKQNAKTAMPEQIRWRDQNPLLLPYQKATGCRNDCSRVLNADPHIA